MTENNENNNSTTAKYNYQNYVNSFYDYSNVEMINEADLINKKEKEEFKNKLSLFAKINTVKAAKDLAKELFHIKNEINYLKAGDATCTIISRSGLLRIILNDTKEVICYNFSSSKEK